VLGKGISFSWKFCCWLN